MLDFDVITTKFGQIQQLAHELGKSISGGGLLLSNVQKTRIRPDSRADLMRAIAEIEDSAIFKDLDKDIQDYTYECESEASIPYFDAQVKKKDGDFREKWKGIRKLITKTELDGYSEDTPTPLRTWLRITGFYEHKVLNRDTADWTEKLLQDLRDYPSQVGAKHYFIALDGMYATQVKFSNVELVHHESPQAAILTRLKALAKHARYFVNQYLASWTVTPERVNLDTFHYLHTRVRYKDSPGLNVARERVLSEHLNSVKLATEHDVSTPNLYMIPESLFDSHDIEFHATKEEPGWARQVALYCSGLEDIEEHIKSITVQEPQEAAFGACCETIYGLLTDCARKGKRTTLQVPIYLYAEACEAENEVLSFLLFCTSLESLIIGGSESELTEKFATRLALLIGSSETERVSLYSEARRIYRLRSKLAHGAKPREALNPYRHTTRQRIRDLARQTIIAALTLTAILDGSESQLQSEVSEVLGMKVGSWRKVLEVLHERLFDSKASDAVQNAMRSWWQKRVRSAGKIMGVPFLEPPE